MPEYNPAVDGRPEPGEIVWTWVAFAQDSREGKDRPVLVLAVDGARLTVLPLRSSSDQHRRGQVWMDLGRGDWDSSGRTSEAQLNRVLTVSIYDVRRRNAWLGEDLFEQVLAAARRYR